jgi:PadR family transcriptional regulator, regulatory protein PadR
MLNMTILKALALGIAQITRGTFQVTPVSLFPALHRTEEQGWLVSFWAESEDNRRAKYYKLTAAERCQQQAENQAQVGPGDYADAGNVLR